MAEKVGQLAVASTRGPLGPQLQALYDGALVSARIDRDAGIAPAALAAVEVLLDAALA